MLAIGTDGQAIALGILTTGADGQASTADGLPTGASGQPTDIDARLMADHMQALQGSATAGVHGRTGHRLLDIYPQSGT